MANFTYNDGVPATNNNPTDDQPEMLLNTIAIQDLIDVDHITFNENDGGTHRQVTFAANESAPGTPGTTVAVAYVNSNAGISGTLSSLFFQNATQNLGLTNLTLTTSGSNYGITTPWGLIINFGDVATSQAGALVTFAIPMNNAQYSMMVTPNSNTFSLTAQAGNLTATTVTVRASAAVTCWYLAIGK